MRVRTYDDACGVARGLDHVGERWGLLIVRELLHGPKRFAELRRGLPRASQNVLTQRLRDLTEAGVIARTRLGPPASAWAYELTPWGQELEAVVRALGRWGSRAPLHTERELSVDSLILALETTFDETAVGNTPVSITLVVGGDRFRASIADGELRITRGDARGVTLSAAVAVVRALAFRQRTLSDVLETGDATIDGDPGAVESFFNCFAVPEPVPA